MGHMAWTLTIRYHRNTSAKHTFLENKFGNIHCKHNNRLETKNHLILVTNYLPIRIYLWKLSFMFPMSNDCFETTDVSYRTSLFPNFNCCFESQLSVFNRILCFQYIIHYVCLQTTYYQYLLVLAEPKRFQDWAKKLHKHLAMDTNRNCWPLNIPFLLFHFPISIFHF